MIAGFSLVAAKADRASTKTIGDIFVQLMFDIATPGKSSDRVLNGPTNDAWINPWLDYLIKKGVRYHTNAKVKAIEYRQGRIHAIRVEHAGKTTRIEGDYFIFAIPIEDIVDLLTPEMISADPHLARAAHDDLRVRTFADELAIDPHAATRRPRRQVNEPVTRVHRGS